MNYLMQNATTKTLPFNGIGLVECTFTEPFLFYSYGKNTDTGGVIFIDCLKNITLGAGLVRAPLKRKNVFVRKFSYFELEMNSFICKYLQNLCNRNLSIKRE